MSTGRQFDDVLYIYLVPTTPIGMRNGFLIGRARESSVSPAAQVISRSNYPVGPDNGDEISKRCTNKDSLRFVTGLRSLVRRCMASGRHHSYQPMMDFVYREDVIGEVTF